METQHCVLGYKIDLYFYDLQLQLAKKLMKMDTVTAILTTKQKDKKQQSKNLIVSLLELILKKKTLICLERSMNYLDTSNNQLNRTMQNKISA